jgi:hypothetical protein
VEIGVGKPEPMHGKMECKTSAGNGSPPRQIQTDAPGESNIASWRTRRRASVAAMPSGNESPFAPRSLLSMSPTGRRGSLAALLSELGSGSSGNSGSTRDMMSQDQQRPQLRTRQEGSGATNTFQSQYGLLRRWLTSSSFVCDDGDLEVRLPAFPHAISCLLSFMSLSHSEISCPPATVMPCRQAKFVPLPSRDPLNIFLGQRAEWLLHPTR